MCFQNFYVLSELLQLFNVFILMPTFPHNFDASYKQKDRTSRMSLLCLLLQFNQTMKKGIE